MVAGLEAQDELDWVAWTGPPQSCTGRSGLLAVRAGRTYERTWTRRWGKTVSGAAAAVWSINIFAIIAKINSAHLTGPCGAGFMVR